MLFFKSLLAAFSINWFILHFTIAVLIFLYKDVYVELKANPCLQYWYLREWQWSQAWASPGVNTSLLPVHLRLCLRVSQQINLNHFSAHPVITVTLCYTVTWHPVLDMMSLGFSRDDWSCLRLWYVGRLVTLGSGRIIQKISKNN